MPESRRPGSRAARQREFAGHPPLPFDDARGRHIEPHYDPATGEDVYALCGGGLTIGFPAGTPVERVKATLDAHECKTKGE